MPRDFTNTEIGEIKDQLSEHIARDEFDRELSRLVQTIQGLQYQVESLRQVVSTIAVIQERQLMSKEEMNRITTDLEKLYESHLAAKEKLDTWVARFGGAMGLLSLIVMGLQMLSLVHK